MPDDMPLAGTTAHGSPDWARFAAGAIVERFADATIAGGARTPFVDYNGALALVSPTDLGIHAARAALARSGIAGEALGATIAGNCTQASFDTLFFARHIGLYSGMRNDKPAHGVQRLCTTGFEAIAQAARMTSEGQAQAVLAVGTESMSRAPIAAYTHRGGFGLGQVEFKDFLWESLLDTASGTAMGNTAENLARLHGISREETDAYAAESFARALAAQQAGRFAEEIAPVTEAVFEAEGLTPRKLSLPRKAGEQALDTHIRPTPVEVLAKLRPVFGGVQTGGNSSAIVDGAAAVVVTTAKAAAEGGAAPLGRVLGAAAAGVPPEVMGIGPVPATLALLARFGLTVADIDLFEINEAFGAQAEAVRRALGVGRDRFNVNGGAIAFGHPLAATGVRCVHSLLLELKRRGAKRGIAGACAGGGQGMAVLVEVA
ncbi:thiolase family protein [Siccirubricoccus sp. KC 17139]|uniref:Thiolase family protein n=1 Tax=Siccirubricoccus soli TaxID=2899147 RepID=A0ABT1D093_9PROT|nr:thiolase family protein [Siccirubricoccus soli]MCO6415323.1 thiolase family protein [Siccirubricoccus soli]MCP2681455.1 thiolase family protein [Siccirubricoccus soli]